MLDFIKKRAINVSTEKKGQIMTTLNQLIRILEEVENLDPENENSQVSIVGKRIFITREDQVDGYYVEIKD